MKVRQKFNIELVNDFQTWVKQLPEHELQEFLEADIRQVKFRQEAIDRGDMIIDPDGHDYVWRDEETAKKNKESDEIWVSYFQRWRQERGLTGDEKVYTFEDFDES